MTEEEHGEVSHVAAILLLGFLVPFSTGNEWFLLQHTRDDHYMQQVQTSSNNNSSNKNIAQPQTLDYIIGMSLEERLENTCQHYAAFEFGEFDTLTDASWELAFDSFLMEGLAPFLGGRPAHYRQVDLIHLLAMVIHPQAFASCIPDTVASLQGKHYWTLACQLMNNRHAHSFHANYGHRQKFIQLVVQHLSLPAFDNTIPMVNCPLFDGALPHLRASLHAFCVGAISMEDAHCARSALVTIATQSQIKVAKKEEWELLINRLVDDRTQYPGCKGCPRMLNRHLLGCWQTTTITTGKDAFFCPHAGRGRNLAEFLIRTCQARRHADSDFLNEAFSSLTDAIEWQMHCWKQEDETEETDSEEPPCMLASLLFAARTFFYFLLPMEELQKQSDDDGQVASHLDVAARRDELKSCVIQLIHHHDANIASQAAELLCLALAYGGKQSLSDCARTLYLSLTLTLDNFYWNRSDPDLFQSSIRKVVFAASRLSPSFALSFLNVLLKKVNGGGPEESYKQDVEMKNADDGNVEGSDTGVITGKHMQFLLRLVSSIALANPVIAAEKADVFLELLQKFSEDPPRCEVIAALLSCRQARFFVTEKDPSEAAVLTTVNHMKGRWNVYQLGKLAMRTGNFGVAHQCYHLIIKSPLSERYFLWITTLANVAKAELCLAKHAAKGIPTATISLRSALSILLSLKALDRSKGADYSRTIKLIRLRLDFLDLLTSLRQLIREIRLTGAGPGKRTRSLLHFQNIVKCFDALSNRYREVYQQYGLFSCQQSRTALRTLNSLCRFVARSTRSVFSDVHPSQKKDENSRSTVPSGDETLPITRFMVRIDEQLLQKMSPSTDLVTRAAAMIEVVDGILLCPVPFPLDHLTVSNLPRGHLQLLADPEQTGIDASDALPDTSRPELDTIECYPGISFDFYAAGEIPASFLTKSRLPFTSVIVMHRAEYVGPIQEEEHIADEKQEDEALADEKHDDDTIEAPLKTIPGPWDYTEVSTSMQTSGKFSVKIECPVIREEGNYVIEVKLRCRDVRGGEWEVAVEEELRRMKVQVTRSLWHC
jgi:hypothetical protein